MDHHDDDDRWDYDCPQYVDFTAPIPFNDGADQMFESTVIGEGPSTSTLQFRSQGTAQPSPSTKAAEPCEESKENRPAAANDGTDNNDNDGGSHLAEAVEPTSQSKEGIEVAEPASKASKPSNLVTSLEEWRRPQKHGATGPEPHRVLIHSEAPGSKKQRRNPQRTSAREDNPGPSSSALTRSKSMRSEKGGSTSSLHSLQRAGSSSSLRSVQRAGSSSSLPRQARNHGRTLSQGSSTSRSSSADGSVASSRNKGGNSAPAAASDKPAKVPSLLKRLGESVSTSKLKSSEDLEMDRIRQLKKELQHKRHMAQESYKKALKAKGPVAVHTKDATVPEEFTFHTDRRLKAATDKATDQKGVQDFVKSLRSRTVMSPGPSSSGPKKLTVPQPFQLTEKAGSSKVATASAAADKFESMAEKVSAFHRKTPERFRARARSGDKAEGRGARSVSPPQRLTQPHTPQLTARNRHRPTHYLSHEQLEQQEVEDMKQKQFKARPVNSRILTQPGPLRRVAVKAPTKVEEFSLSSAHAASSCATARKKDSAAEPSFEFHAQPLNKKILEGPVGVKPVKPALPTVPQSPAFALKNRVRLPVEVPEDKVETVEAVRAKPVPHIGIPFQPKLPHQHTVPEPFAVETRSRAMLAQKEEKIRNILEEERKAREFYAQPIPSHDPVLPEKVVKESTVPEPFSLETDQRGDFYQQELAHKVGTGQLTEEEEEQRKAVQFRAQPARSIHTEPFIPAKSTKALTEISDFELNSDRRAVEREEFELRKKQREVELEGHRRQREQRENEEEEAAIARLRAEMVHRPNPIRQYVPVLIRPSEKPLTEAESPQFSDRLRAKVRM